MATRTVDYSRWTRGGFGAGVALFAIAVLSHFVGPTVIDPFPALYETILFDMEVLGVLIALFVPILFGIVLPLTE